MVKVKLCQTPFVVYTMLNLFITLHGNEDCSRKLGMENGDILDEQITASSEKSSLRTRAKYARLTNFRGWWSPRNNNENEWLQVDFRQVLKVTGILTQGRPSVSNNCCDRARWVESYAVSYSQDDSKYELYKDANNQQVFTGNQDRNTIVEQNLSPPIFARYIRINPRTWNGHISLRIEFLGCSDTVPSAVTGFTKTASTRKKTTSLTDIPTITATVGYTYTHVAVIPTTATNSTLAGNSSSHISVHNFSSAIMSIINARTVSSKYSNSTGVASFTNFVSAGDSAASVNSDFAALSTSPVTVNNISNTITMKTAYTNKATYTANPSANSIYLSAITPATAVVTTTSIATAAVIEVEGNWTEWMAWSECNRPCGTGKRRRTRSCANPAPAHGGKNCEGEDAQSRVCNTNACPAVTATYTVRLLAETWSDDLTKNGNARTEIENKIENSVRYSHHTVMNVEVIELRNGSVIVTFNVSYRVLDEIQILVVQESLAENRLGDMPAELIGDIVTDNVPNEVPNITEAFATSSTSIYITWSAITDTNGAPLLGYAIFYRQINFQYQPDVVKSVKSNVTETRLENLKKFTNYVIRILAFTKKGNGVSSERVTVRTDEDVPSGPPPNCEVFVHSSTTMTVIWDNIDQTDVHGVLKGYNVSYGRHEGRANILWKSEIVLAREISLVLKDLQKFTYYSILVCAFTSKGCGVESRKITVRTRGDSPSVPPQDVKVLDLFSLCSIRVSWGLVPAGQVNGDLQGYKLTYQLIKASDQHVRDTKETLVTLGPQNLSIGIQELRSFAVYKIKVAAFTKWGTGPYSEYVTAETCRCPKVLYTNYWAHPPYVRRLKNGTVEGIFPKILEDMVRVACDNCINGHGETIVNTTTNGQADEPAFKTSYNHVLQDIDDVPQIHFPIYGNKYVTKYLGTYTYVYLVESPGVVFVTVSDPTVSTQGTLVFRAALVGVPLITLALCMAFISGFVFWMSECKSNSSDIQPSFLRGFGQGIWLSFVSMTTVGYGDKSPVTLIGRLFCIAWILIGMVIISIVTSCISTELTSYVTHGNDVIIYGSKVAAIQNSTEYRLGILMNAVVNKDRQYKSIEEIVQALQTREVQGALVDTYVAAEHQEELFTKGVRVSKVLDKSFGYGIVLSGAAANAKKGFDDYIKKNIKEILRIIESNTRIVSVPEKSTAEETSAGLFDSSSSAFLWTVRVVGGVITLATLLGLVWYYGILRPIERRHKKPAATTSKRSQYKAMLIEEMHQVVDEFYKSAQETSKKLAHTQRQQLRQLISLNRNNQSVSMPRRNRFISPPRIQREDIELVDMPVSSRGSTIPKFCGANRVGPSPSPAWY